MDVDRPSWGSTLVKNHDENKTYILVKLSESFSNAIQEYSAAQSHQSINNNYINHTNTSTGSSNYNTNSTNKINSHNHHHHQNGSISNNHKRPKLQHNTNNNNDNNSNSHANQRTSNNNSNVNQQTEAPTIKFQGTRGAIRFPNGKTYDFSLEQSDNSVECIRQTKNKCESVGKVACCLHVKGKDDVYQRTRTKMEAAEQEKRKYCTKLLGSPENNTTLERSTNHSITSAPTIKPTKLLDNNTITITPATSNNTTSTTKSSLLSSSSSLLSSSSSSSSSSSHTPTTNSHTTNHHQLHSSNTNLAANNNINNNNNNNNNNNYVNLSKYPDITDVKQLKKYKADFDKDYKEYQNLHGYLHRIEERFKKLRESLRQSVEGSSEWESAKEQIFNEYERVKSDSNFHRARSKYKQLYDKLAHIKEKIFQFKRQQRDKFKKRK